MKAVDADDDVRPNEEDENISAHAEANWFEPEVGSDQSFVQRDWDFAAAVALGEAQDGLGQKLVNAAGEITEEAQRALSQKHILSDSEKHTYSDQLLHLAKLGLPQNCLPTQEVLSKAYIAAREEKDKQLRRSYDFLKNAITKYDETMAGARSSQLSSHTDLGAQEKTNEKSEKDKKESAVVSQQTKCVKKVHRKRDGFSKRATRAAEKSERIALKRSRRLLRLGLSDQELDPTREMLEKAYIQEMQKVKSSEFPSDKKKQKAKDRVSRAFRYLMKVRVEVKTPRG